MANQLAQNPWVLDEVGVLTALPMKLAQIELVDYTADADFAILKNNEGKVVAILNGSADLSTVRTGKIGWVHGLTLDTLSLAGSGNVLVYFE